MFHMKNNGSALVRESNITFDNFPLGLSVLIVDRDQQSLQEMEAILRGSGFEGYFLFRSFFMEFILQVSNGRELSC